MELSTQSLKTVLYTMAADKAHTLHFIHLPIKKKCCLLLKATEATLMIV